MARPMTRQELRENAFARLGETAGFYVDDQLNQWIADGIDEIALRVEPLVVSATMDVVADTGEYLLPTNLISIKFALFEQPNGDWGQLRETQYSRLFEANPNWETETTTTPSMWYWRQDVIGLYPIPDTSNTDALRIVYTCRPPEPAGDSSTSGIPDFFDRAIVSWVIYKALLKDRQQERAAIVRAEFEEMIGTGQQVLNKHRKDHAPRLVPQQRAYRQYFARGGRRQRWYSESL